jgi:hypothetical protein
MNKLGTTDGTIEDRFRNGPRTVPVVSERARRMTDSSETSDTANIGERGSGLLLVTPRFERSPSTSEILCDVETRLRLLLTWASA